MLLHAFFLSASYFIVVESDYKYLESNKIGLDAVDDVRIDKDTIFSRNMNLKSKTHSKVDKARSDPDWSYSSFPKEIKNDVEEFKRNMSICLKEVKANDKRKVTRLSPNKGSPVHAECLIACVLKRNSVIENGKINKDNLLKLISKFYGKDERLIKKLEKKLDGCIEVSVQTRDDCTMAARLNECTNDLMASNKHKININY